MPGLVPAVLVLLLLDVVGAAWAVTSGVNSLVEAFSSSARMAAPWPMMFFQIIMTLVAWRSARGWAITASGLLALACLLSAISGFFDGALGASGLSRAQVAFQYALVSWTAVVGGLAVARLRALRPGSA